MLVDRRSSTATIAAFIAGEIRSAATGSRFWSNRYAIGAPVESVIVEVCGNCPVARSVDTLFTLSPASLDTIPTANAPGNAIPATNTPASTHSASSKPTGRSR